MFTYGHIETVNREQHQDRLRRAEKNQLVEQASAGRKRSRLRHVISKFSSTADQKAGRQAQPKAADLANQSA
jgi:hypothetical protein